MGYREHSYDPSDDERLGAPMKPFNWVQWTGVAIGGVGALLITIDVLGRLGWIPQWIEDPSPASFMLLLLGTVLINSRREPSSQVTEEQRAKNRRTLIISAIICAAVLGVAALIEFQGA